MDLIACSESATDKAAKKAHKREIMSIRSDKDKLFPEEAQVIVIKKGQGNRLNSLETEISLLGMHNEIMEGLIENAQHFLDKVKTIFINEQRLQKMIPRMTLAYQILMENAKGSKQQRNENENNGKEDDEEKGKGGGEKVEEKGGERRGANGELEGGGEKRKADEKGEERGGANGEVEGGGEKERVSQKVGENNGGRRVENADEKIEAYENGREKESESGEAENEICVDSDAKFEDYKLMDSLYLALFSSTDAETTFQLEALLGVKLMETLIYQTEKAVINPVNFTEINTTRAKLRAMMAVQLHFRNADKFRIICYQIAYVAYLVNKRNFPFTDWRSPTECFLNTREETLSSMRTVLRNSHWGFVVNRVTGTVRNGISDTVRHKRGAIALLEKLIGGTAMAKLWENKEARAKLMEANCK
ncbi:hypothetical protein niasHT_014505 [Heterodera trifolii]|uniref:Uncharacterized protein n=1 Tax=Heterodera trifolii TaxID=157864 RepID=A0ABD2KZS9_9BILA